MILDKQKTFDKRTHTHPKSISTSPIFTMKLFFAGLLLYLIFALIFTFGLDVIFLKNVSAKHSLSLITP